MFKFFALLYDPPLLSFTVIAIGDPFGEFALKTLHVFGGRVTETGPPMVTVWTKVISYLVKNSLLEVVVSAALYLKVNGEFALASSALMETVQTPAAEEN